MSVIATIIASLIFGLLFRRIKIPGGMMVGAIAGAFLLNLIFDYAYMPTAARTITQIISGTIIACSINKEDITNFHRIIRPFAILISGYLLVNLAAGFIIYRISNLDLLTSLMSAVPGGITDIPIISAEMGAVAPKVALLQFIRMFMAFALFPSIIVKMTGDRKKLPSDKTPEPGRAAQAPLPDSGKPSVPSPLSSIMSSKVTGKNSANLAITLSVAACMGIIGRLSGIPAGTLIFAITGVSILKFATGRAYMPVTGRRIAQVLAGAYIGSCMTRSEIFEIRNLVLPAIILVCLYCVNSVVMGYILHKKCGLELREAMFSSIPAGASEMALIANDLGVQSITLAKMQIMRILCVIAVFPQVIALVVFLLS